MTEEQKNEFWDGISEEKFSEEVYYQIDTPPTEDGATKDELYDAGGKIKKQKWTPDETFRQRVVDYAVLPDGEGTPNEILRYALLDEDGNEVEELTIAGEGRYVIDPETGEVTFTPEKGFSGKGKGVTVRVIDMLGAEYGVGYPTARYVPEVIKNDPVDPTEPTTDPTEPSTDPTEPSTDPTAAPTDPTSRPTKDSDSLDGTRQSSATGDRAVPFVAGGIMALAAIVIIIMIRRRRQKSR